MIGTEKIQTMKENTLFFAAMYLEHNHIYGMCDGLIQGGGILKSVYDPDKEKARSLAARFPGAKAVESEEEILKDPEILLVAAAAVPCERCQVGIRCMEAGKDYFTDKGPFTALEQLELARKKVEETGRKYMVYYSERLHSECSVYAGQLVKAGAIGRVLSVTGLGPHRLGNPEERPEWFYEKARYGGIICDIGSHQVEQFLYFTGCEDAKIESARTANYGHPQYPELEDYGDVMLTGDNGSAGYFRVDWFTPDGLSVWGDGRTLILGTEGYIELRKTVNVAADDPQGDLLILVDKEGEKKISCRGTTGYPFFGQLIRDCLDRTETAMTQAHVFKAAQIVLQCQEAADRRK